MSWWKEKFGLEENPFDNRPLNEDMLSRGAYQVTNALKKAESLFIRKYPSSGSFLIYGKVGVGKTSLFKYVEFHLKLRYSHIKVRIAQEGQASTTDDLQERIYYELFKLVGEEPPKNKIKFVDIIELIERHEKDDAHYLLFIDELHKLKDDIVLEFIKKNQALSEKFIDAGNFTLVMATNEGIGGIIYGPSTKTNIYSGFFRDNIEIETVTPIEAKNAMLKKWIGFGGSESNFPFTSGAIEELVRWGEGVLRNIFNGACRVLEKLDPSIDVVDEYAVQTYIGDLDKDTITEIVRKMAPPTYEEVKNSLETLFSEKESAYMKLDLSKILDFFYISRSYISFAELKKHFSKPNMLSLPIEKLIEILSSYGLVDSRVRPIKGMYGTTQIKEYKLNDKVQRLFDLIWKDHRLTPFQFLPKLFRTDDIKIETIKKKRTSDPILIRFNYIANYIERTKEEQHLRLIKAARQNYVKAKDKKLDKKEIVRCYYDTVNYLIKLYNIKYRNEVNISFIDGANRLISEGLSKDSIEYFKEIQNAYKKTYELLQPLNDEEFSSLKRTYKKVVDRITMILEFKLNYLEKEKDKKIDNEFKFTYQNHFDFVVSRRKKFEEEEIRNHAIKVQTWLKEYTKAPKFPELTKYDIFWSKFFEDMKNAGEMSSLIYDGFMETLYDYRFQNKRDKISRCKILQNLSCYFEEFLKSIIPQYTGHIRVEGRKLHEILDELIHDKNYSAALRKYGHFKKDEPERLLGKVIPLFHPSESEDESLRRLNDYQISTILTTLVRNYMIHNLKVNIFVETMYDNVVKKIIESYLWIYEYILKKYGKEGPYLIKREDKDIILNNKKFILVGDKEQKAPYLLGDILIKGEDSVLFKVHETFNNFIKLPNLSSPNIDLKFFPTNEQKLVEEIQSLKEKGLLENLVVLKLKYGIEEKPAPVSYISNKLVVFKKNSLLYRDLLKIKRRYKNEEIENWFVIVNRQEIIKQYENEKGLIKLKPYWILRGIDEVAEYVKSVNLSYKDVGKYLDSKDLEKLSLLLH